MIKLQRFFLAWRSFFFPAKGWKEMYLAFKRGHMMWEIPGKPPVCPFPLEWLPVRLALTEGDSEEAHQRGFAFDSAVCTDTGVECLPGVGVRCLRCRVPLSPEAADAVGPIDPPTCARCRPVVRLLT